MKNRIQKPSLGCMEKIDKYLSHVLGPAQEQAQKLRLKTRKCFLNFSL